MDHLSMSIVRVWVAGAEASGISRSVIQTSTKSYVSGHPFPYNSVLDETLQVPLVEIAERIGRKAPRIV